MRPCFEDKPQGCTFLPQLASKIELNYNRMAREEYFTSFSKLGLGIEGYFTSFFIPRVYSIKTLKTPKYHGLSI
jgi:hypothetical protein